MSAPASHSDKSAARRELPRRSTTGRQRWNNVFLAVCLGSALVSLLFLVVLLASVVSQAAPAFVHFSTSFPWVSVDTAAIGRFLTGINSAEAANAGIFPAMMGSLFVCVGCALLSLPIGVATAIYLEEFKPRNKTLRAFRAFIQLNISNLAGVPSVVYGILGLTAFVQMFSMFGSVSDPAFEIGVTHYLQYPTENPKRFIRIPVANRGADSIVLKDGMQAFTSRGVPVEVNVIAEDAPAPTDRELMNRTVREGATGSVTSQTHWYYVRLPLGAGVLAGSLTLMLVVLPVVIISTQEALRAVPDSLREGALGLGATRWQTVWNITLPASIPGIMTGAILAMSRAIGEAAPILLISGIVFIATAPKNLVEEFSVMPLQIYDWAGKPANQGFHSLAASGIMVLLAMLLVFNGIAVFIRHRLQKPLS